jgi:diacylglycerol kinase family enzyme
MKHVFVFDPKAFFNQQWKMDNILDTIGQFFRTQDRPDFSIQFSRYRRNAISIIQEESEKAKEGDVVRIYAVGGEEIMFDCLNGVVHFPNTELAVIPYGESNDFLKIFGDDKTEEFRDIATIVRGKALATDAIMCGVNYALNSCHIGMNSAISKKLNDLKVNLNKRSVVFFTKISSFFSNFFVAFDKQSAGREYKVTVDDVSYDGKYSVIHIANGPYHAGRLTGVVKTAMPNDGILDIALIKAAHPLKTLWSTRRYSRGKRPKNCVFLQGKKITVQADDPIWIQLDDEYIQNNNISLGLVHHAVQMVAINDLSYPVVSNPAL